MLSMILSQLENFPRSKFSVNFARFFTYNFGLKWNFKFRKRERKDPMNMNQYHKGLFGVIFLLTLKTEFFIKNRRKMRYSVLKMTIAELR